VSSTDNTNATRANSPRLITEWRIQKRVEEQFQAFIAGFHELIPADLVNVFDERELELLIGGIADIDVDDWKKHTDYRGYTENDEVIQNFWKCIRSWDAEQKSRLLQFATGTSRIPVNGFKDLQGSDGPRRFTIEKAGEPNQLPKSHTWYVVTSPFVPNLFFERMLTTSIVSTASIYQGTSLLKHLTRNSRLRLRRRLGLDRNRARIAEDVGVEFRGCKGKGKGIFLGITASYGSGSEVGGAAVCIKYMTGFVLLCCGLWSEVWCVTGGEVMW
jgi:hypothetical protein